MMGHAYECNQNILVLVQVNPGVTKRVNASLCDTKIDLTLKYFKLDVLPSEDATVTQPRVTRPKP